MNKISWKYIAGFFDADGSVVFHKFQKKFDIYPEIIIGNTNKGVLESIKNFTDLGYIIKTNRHKKRCLGIKNRKILWRYQIGVQKDIREFLKRILPFLIIKKEKAKKAIAITMLYKSYSSKHASNH